MRLKGLPRLRRSASTRGEALGMGHEVAGGAGHRHVAVSFQQRHQPADPADHGALLGAGDHPGDAGLAHLLAGVVRAPPRIAQGGEQRIRTRVDRPEHAVDQPGVVVAHPRHPGELRPVGELVDQHPGAELVRLEAEALLQRGEVRADQVDRAVGRRIGAAHEQVVLPEHPGAHPAEQRAELGAGHLPGERAQRPGAEAGLRPLLLQLGQHRCQKRLERGEVGPDPRRPVDQLGRRRAFHRAQSGDVFDLLLDLLDRRVPTVELGATVPASVRRCAPRSARRAPSRSSRRPRQRDSAHSSGLRLPGYCGATTLRR